MTSFRRGRAFGVWSVLAALACGGCVATPPPEAPAAKAAPTATNAKAEVERKEAVRKIEQQIFARGEDQLDETFDRLEKDVLRAIQYSRGERAQTTGALPPEPAALALFSMRIGNAGIKIEAVPDTSKGLAEDLVQLTDSLGERQTRLEYRVKSGKATKKEKKELEKVARLSSRLPELRAQIAAVAAQTVETNKFVQFASLVQTLRSTSLLRARKVAGLELDAEDLALVRRGLERQRRAETLAAATLGLLAAYEVSANEEVLSETVIEIADAAAAALPTKASVSLDETREYVKSLGGDPKKAKERLEAEFWKSLGESRYDQEYKRGLEALFVRATSPKPPPPPPPEAVAAKPAAAPAGGGARDTAVGLATLTAATLGQSALSGRAPKVDTGTALKVGGQLAGDGKLGGTLKGAAAAQNGDALGTASAAASLLSSTAAAPAAAPAAPAEPATVATPAFDESTLRDPAKTFPSEGMIGHSLRALVAVRKIEPRTAFGEASTLSAPPVLRDALVKASKRGSAQ